MSVAPRWAEGALRESRRFLRDAENALSASEYAHAIGAAADSIERSVKAALAWAGVRFPSEHDVSGILRRNRARFPVEYRGRITDWSSALHRAQTLRNAAKYGSLESDASPDDLFPSPEPARELLDLARTIYTSVRSMFRRAPASSVSS